MTQRAPNSKIVDEKNNNNAATNLITADDNHSNGYTRTTGNAHKIALPNHIY